MAEYALTGQIRWIFLNTYTKTTLHFLLRTRMTLITTFQHTPFLSSKGTVCIGNASQFRVYHPKSYCTILFSSVIRAGRPASNGIWFKMFSGLLKLIIHDYLGQWFLTPSDALSSVHGALSLLGEVLVFEKGQLNQLSQWPKFWGPTALQILYVFLI